MPVAHVRPTTLADTEAISAVRQRNGLTALDCEEWLRWCEINPFHDAYKGVTTGWVLATETGEVVGALSNIQMLYDFGGRPIRAATAGAWAVDREYRRQSLLLLTTYFQQNDIDLWVDGSANEAASKILTAMKVPRIPAPDYDVPLLWPVRYRAFARAGVRRKGWSVPEGLIWPLAGGLRMADWVRRGPLPRPTKVRRLEGFDERFERFWEKLRFNPQRMRAVRTRASLEWRFHRELRTGAATVLVRENGHNLLGYAVLLENFRDHLGLKMCDLADLQALGDDRETIRDLLLGAFHAARDKGAEAVKFLGSETAKRSVALSLKPYSYRSSPWQLFYKIRDESLRAVLAEPQNWAFSPFDTF